MQHKPLTCRAWLRARARLLPNVLTASPSWVCGAFDHPWAPMQALERQIEPVPPQLWEYMLSLEDGFVAIGPGESRYVPGPGRLGTRMVTNVAYVSAQDLALDNERPIHVIGHLVDHHLGNGGAAEGAWLSEGGGVRPRWQEAGRRLPRLFALGYGVDEVARANVRDYFAQSLALFCRDRQRLNTADPQIDKWLRSTLWDDTFWKE